MTIVSLVLYGRAIAVLGGSGVVAPQGEMEGSESIGALALSMPVAAATQAAATASIGWSVSKTKKDNLIAAGADLGSLLAQSGAVFPGRRRALPNAWNSQYCAPRNGSSGQPLAL